MSKVRANRDLTGKQRRVLAEMKRMEASGVKREDIVKKLRKDPVLSGYKVDLENLDKVGPPIRPKSESALKPRKGNSRRVSTRAGRSRKSKVRVNYESGFDY